MSIKFRDSVVAAHEALDPEVRDVPWLANCAGELHVLRPDSAELRIGHFQGDAKLAAFAVAAHQAALGAAPPPAGYEIGSALFRERVPEAAALQLATVLAWLTEQQLETLEQLEASARSAKSAVTRQRQICDTAVAQCAELGVTPRGLAGGECTRLARRLASLNASA
jgi:hypothetical protein